MGFRAEPAIVIVTRPTRMRELQDRWATQRAATFRLQASSQQEVERRVRRKVATGVTLDEAEIAAMEAEVDDLADQASYEQEDALYFEALAAVRHEVDVGVPVLEIDRSYLPNFDFGRCVAVVVVGQDGLVANAATYVGDLPIIGVNPDPSRIDGILVPHHVRTVRRAVQQALAGRADIRRSTLGEVNTNDGQRMLAFNDFFVGASSHISARYSLEVDGVNERQSSSGVIISTGAGSTGWLSSLFNMVNGFNREFARADVPVTTMDWEMRRLAWAVREPFCSRQTTAERVVGWIDEREDLVIASHMPQAGVIFSDGIESDFIEFTTGTIARFSVSAQRAHLVV